VWRTAEGYVTPDLEPPAYTLFQNYPNPFNPSTDIEFRILKPGFVTIKIFDLLGREVATVLNDWRAPGEHHITWAADAMASGVYLYRLEVISANDPSKHFSQIRKMILIK
jgi:hypothetical protein